MHLHLHTSMFSIHHSRVRNLYLPHWQTANSVTHRSTENRVNRCRVDTVITRTVDTPSSISPRISMKPCTKHSRAWKLFHTAHPRLSSTLRASRRVFHAAAFCVTSRSGSANHGGSICLRHSPREMASTSAGPSALTAVSTHSTSPVMRRAAWR